jgi:thiamine biosynthesis lipoprotein
MTRSFRAMGCTVVVAGATPDELADVRVLFESWERIFSRFRRGSELNRVNAVRSATVAVSPLFSQAVECALRAARSTGGLVDPTLGVAIEAAGYDRRFTALRPDARPVKVGPRGAYRDVSIYRNVLVRPPGVLLDLNGVVKALAVEEALGVLAGRGFVSAGGDLAVRGDVQVAVPGGAAVRLHGGGMATSGTTRRRWLRAGTLQHHLIDPRTGAPSRSRWQEVTVAAPTCVAADVAAKAAFLLDGDGPDWLDERGLVGRFVGADGIVENAAWQRSMRGQEDAACR